MPRSRIGIPYRVVAAIVKPWLLAVAKRDWRGMENIPAEGGFITVVNHNSYLDPLSYAHFQYNTGRVPRFLAKESLFRIPAAGKLLNATGQIPVYRDSADASRAFRAAVDAVERGECVAVYPEGTLTRDPDLWPMAAKTGAARIALLTGAPVIPVAQWGAQRIVPPYAKGKKKGEPRLRLFPRSTLQVLAGPPVDLADLRGKEPTPDVLREATDRIMDAVTGRLEELRGEQAPAVRYDMRTARARRLGGAPAPEEPAADTRTPAADTTEPTDNADNAEEETAR